MHARRAFRVGWSVYTHRAIGEMEIRGVLLLYVRGVVALAGEIVTAHARAVDFNVWFFFSRLGNVIGCFLGNGNVVIQRYELLENFLF